MGNNLTFSLIEFLWFSDRSYSFESSIHNQLSFRKILYTWMSGWNRTALPAQKPHCGTANLLPQRARSSNWKQYLSCS